MILQLMLVELDEVNSFAIFRMRDLSIRTDVIWLIRSKQSRNILSYPKPKLSRRVACIKRILAGDRVFIQVYATFDRVFFGHQFYVKALWVIPACVMNIFEGDKDTVTGSGTCGNRFIVTFIFEVIKFPMIYTCNR